MSERERMDIEAFALSMLWRVGERDPNPYNFTGELITIPRIVQMIEHRYGDLGREVLRGIHITYH